MGSNFGKRLEEMKKRQEESGTPTIADVLTEAKEGILYSQDFFKAMTEIDTLGIAYLRNMLGYSPSKAAEAWYKKPWKDQVEAVSQNPAAKGAIETVQLFSGNDLLGQTLQTVIDEVGRPARRVVSGSQLAKLLGELHMEGLALELDHPPGFRKAFKLGSKWYTSTSVQKARIAWPFVLRALGRVRAFERVQGEIIPKIQPLLDLATLDSNPEEQNLNKILTFPDHTGGMIIWDADTKVRTKNEGEEKEEPAGLLAVHIGRLMTGSDLVLQGWVADKPLSLPKDECYELPHLTVLEKFGGKELEVGFDTTGKKLPKEDFNSILRIQRLIRYWLRQEGRFQMPALKAPVAATK